MRPLNDILQGKETWAEGLKPGTPKETLESLEKPDSSISAISTYMRVIAGPGKPVECDEVQAAVRVLWDEGEECSAIIAQLSKQYGRTAVIKAMKEMRLK